MPALKGVYPILATTFDEDASLDLVSQARLVEHLLAAGAHGLGLFGNAGEGYTLTEDERRTLLDLVANLVNGCVPLVVSLGHAGSDAAVRLSREAEERGAAALMVPPPSYIKTDADGLMRYFEAIGRTVRIPIMVQDAPLMTEVPMPSALLARMSREIGSVRYVKVEAPPTAPKVTAVLRESEGRLMVFGGLNGQFLIEEAQRGAQGTMPGSDMIPDFVHIWDCCQAGRQDDAWAEFTRILPLIRFELQPRLGVSAMKHNLHSLGVIASTRVRHPTLELDARGVEELKVLRRICAASEVRLTR